MTIETIGYFVVVACAVGMGAVLLRLVWAGE